MHLFCENRRAGQFNGRRLGEDVAAKENSTILRVWSNDSTPGVERYTSENYGGLKRVLHLAEGAPVMLTYVDHELADCVELGEWCPAGGAGTRRER